MYVYILGIYIYIYIYVHTYRHIYIRTYIQTYRVELLELGVVLEHFEAHAVALPEVAQPLDVVVTVRASRVAEVA
jgi:hypothetical protein